MNKLSLLQEWEITPHGATPTVTRLRYSTLRGDSQQTQDPTARTGYSVGGSLSPSGSLPKPRGNPSKGLPLYPLSSPVEKVATFSDKGNCWFAADLQQLPQRWVPKFIAGIGTLQVLNQLVKGSLLAQLCFTFTGLCL